MRQSKLFPHLSSSPQTSRRAPKRRRRARAYVSESSGESGDSDIAAIPFEPKPPSQPQEGSSDDDEVTELSPTKSQSSPVKRTQRICLSDDEDPPSTKQQPSLVTSLLSDSDSDSEGNITRKGKTSRVAVLDSDEEVPRKKARLSKGTRPLFPEQDPIDEVDESVILDTRMRERGKKSRYLQNLEKLKRKKQGRHTDDDSENESEGFVPFEGSRPAREGLALVEETDGLGDESDFIVEDDNAPVDLPGEFSRHRHRDLSENFKILCQLLVHVALQDPEFRGSYMSSRLEEPDEYFSMARDALDKKMSAILTQSVTSQIWKEPFLKALAKHPNLNLDRLEEVVYHCAACNSSRPSTVYAIASGPPYNKIGYEPSNSTEAENSEDDEESDEGDDRREFFLGRFCAARARLHHSFIHWEYSLFRSLEQEAACFSSAKDGDAVMERLVKKGVIEQEFMTIKRLIRRAQNSEGDDDGL